MTIAVKNFYPYGDSATLNGNYPTYLLGRLGNARSSQLWRATPAMNAVGGRTVATGAASIDAELASAVGTPDIILFSLGKNDVGGALPAEATWKANLAYILDAMHTKWPSASILLMRIWRRDCLANCNLIATWISDVIATRVWAGLGPDERGFLEGGDNGVTYTSDGIHPNDAGDREVAAQWLALM